MSPRWGRPALRHRPRYGPRLRRARSLSSPRGRLRSRPRAATAVAVLEQPPAPSAPSALEQTIVFEVRAALRGSSPPELATALSAPLAAVVAALELLRVRGTLVQRGARWFTA